MHTQTFPISLSCTLLTLPSPLSFELQQVPLSPHPSRAVRCSIITCLNTADATLPLSTAKSQCNESKMLCFYFSIRCLFTTRTAFNYLFKLQLFQNFNFYIYWKFSGIGYKSSTPDSKQRNHTTKQYHNILATQLYWWSIFLILSFNRTAILGVK